MSRSARTLLASILLGFGASAVWAQTATEFDLPPQPLAESLTAVGIQAKINVVSKPSLVDGRQAPALKATLTPQQALTLLLADTGLEYRFVNEQTVVIRSASASTDTPARRDLPKDEGQERPLALAQAQAQNGSDPRAGTNDQSNSLSADRERSGGHIEEIVVTAQKRSERLQDVPVPVSAIRGEALVDSNRLRLQDFYNKIPGLGLAISGNGGEPSINIRGITTGGYLVNPTVGIAIDDVPYGSSVGQTLVPDIDPSDLDRVEVLRGPQGTLYGAASIGGLLKFVTIDPSTDALSGRIQAGTTHVHRSDDFGYNIRASVNVPLSDTFAIRASGFTSRDPGYVDNVQTGEEDINERDSDGGRLSALWRPSEDFSLKISALAQDTERKGSPDVNVALGGDLQQGMLLGTGYYRRKASAYSAIATAALGRSELTSVTGYNVDELADNFDISRNAFHSARANLHFGVTSVSVPLQTEVEKFTQELRVVLPLGERIQWLLGAFYTDEDLVTRNDVTAVDASTGARQGFTLRNFIPSTFEEYALFTNVTVGFTERFDVQLGGRISENEQTFATNRFGPLAIFFSGSDPFFSPVIRSKDEPFTYLVTPRLRVSQALMVYARVASGYRPGGPNINCGLPDIPCEFDPDTTQNYEIGIKGSLFDRALSYDASIYHIDWKDIQIPGLRTPASPATFIGNATRARSEGVELALEAKPARGLTLATWIAYGDAELTEDFTAPGAVGRSGDRLPFSARLTGYVSAEQEFPLSGTTSAFVGAAVSYVDARKGLFRAPPVTPQEFPSYTQIDLRLGMRKDTWTLSAFANNLSDERGVLGGGLDSLVAPTFFTYIQPRTMGLSLTKAFD